MQNLSQKNIVDLAVSTYNYVVNLYKVKGHELGGGYQLQVLYPINTQADQVMMAGPMFIDKMLKNLGFENGKFSIIPSVDDPKTEEIASHKGSTKALETMFGALYNQYSGKPVQDNLDSLKSNPTAWEGFKDLLNK